MYKSYLRAVILAPLLIAGCGGGSDNSDNDADLSFDTPVVAGVWRGSATLIENSCSVPDVPPVLTLVHTINQNGTDVIVDTESGNHLVGNTVLDNGLSVDSQSPADDEFLTGFICSLSENIQYEGVDSDTGDGNSNTADLQITNTGTCNSTAGCRIVYNGTAVRTGGATTNTPTPEVTATPVSASDCVLMSERTYSGNNGCGLGSVTVSISSLNGSPTVALEPFGLNGSTAFVPDTTRPDIAASVRSDLTLLGTTGYTCALECSAPLTFDVECTKEGGTSCKETF